MAARTPFGKALVGLMDAKGWSIREFSRQNRLNQTYMGRLLVGKHRPPLERLDGWLDLLDASPAQRDQVYLLALEECQAQGMAARWRSLLELSIGKP